MSELLTRLAQEKLERLRKGASRRFPTSMVIRFPEQRMDHVVIPASGFPVLALEIAFEVKPLVRISYSKSHFIFDILREL